jgi:hypothetical protein
MTIENIVMAVAGFFVMLSLALGWSASPIFHHEYWLFFTGFVGLNVFQSAFTGFCPLALILKAMGFKSATDAA